MRLIHTDRVFQRLSSASLVRRSRRAVQPFKTVVIALPGKTGRVSLWVIQEMGRMFLFLLQVGLWALRPPFRPREILKQLHVIGFKTTFVVVLTAIFTGMVLALQGYYSLRKFGAEALLGSAVALSMIRELGPVLASLMVTARSGSAMTAEIGLMRITEQIDALETMAVNPVQYLITPKMLAAILVVPLLVSMFDVVGIWGGYVVGVQLLGASAGSFWSSVESAVEWRDVYGGLLKAVSFGVIVSWVCCYKGFYTQMSAEGLGKATTEAVVLTSVLILVWDYFLTSVLL
ncbi:MAG: ABC transporter permease [Nitrospirae bacterium]|nr:MAG: ABC transporter permease [Nitrospirota bacterium]